MDSWALSTYILCPRGGCEALEMVVPESDDNGKVVLDIPSLCVNSASYLWNRSAELYVLVADFVFHQGPRQCIPFHILLQVPL